MGLFTNLNAGLLGRNTWPPPSVRERWETAQVHADLRDNDEPRVRMEAGKRWSDPYIVSPLPRLISRASANLLFGQPARFHASNESDAPNLDYLVQQNDLASELLRAATLASSEGEVWGRIVVAPGLLDVPIIEWVSTARVIPSWSGRFLTGATFVTELPRGQREVIRLFETYTAGMIETAAYRGTASSIGQSVSLDSVPELAGRQETVVTGVDQPLVAFIPNGLGGDPTTGISDYSGMRDRFLALNEATTIAQQNLKLAGRKRALIDAAYLDQTGRFVDGDDVYIRTDKDETFGDAAKPLQMIEYGYESQALIAWLDHLLDSTLTYAGLSPQSVGRGVDGGASSGTALRLKMNHTLIEAAGKGRHFDRGIARLLRFAQLIDSRPTTDGGFGRRWTAPDEQPRVERHDGLIRDDLEAAQIVTGLLGVEAVSHAEAIRELHPDWTPDQISAELDAISGPTMPGAPATISTTRPRVSLPSTP